MMNRVLKVALIPSKILAKIVQIFVLVCFFFLEFLGPFFPRCIFFSFVLRDSSKASPFSFIDNNLFFISFLTPYYYTIKAMIARN